MLFLRAFERWPSAAFRPLLSFGRVPLFYYFLHVVKAEIRSGIRLANLAQKGDSR
jgi:hypothetical protein